MIEVQIRRPCSQPELKSVNWGVDGIRSHCPECGEYTYRVDKYIEHKLVVEWVPFSELLAGLM
jgi:hypothetical protein